MKFPFTPSLQTSVPSLFEDESVERTRLVEEPIEQVDGKPALKKKYNTTDLDPEAAFERHIFHRDMFAHYLRWAHILNVAKVGEIIVDFGCGKGNLLEVLYRNRFKCKEYIGIDIRKQTINKSIEKYKSVSWAKFLVDDLVFPIGSIDFSSIGADKVCSFEVIEHVGKQNAAAFLKNFKACGNENAVYYLSTPNYDEKVGAAGNHTYDSGDGRGTAVQEFGHEELKQLLLEEFTIVEYYGTFASKRDYKQLMTSWQLKMHEALSEYYESSLVSIMMAPMFPAHSRNTLWVMKRKSSPNQNNDHDQE